MSSRVASGFSSVWSIRRAISASIGPTAAPAEIRAAPASTTFARFARALFSAALIATGADELVNFKPAEISAFFGAEVSEDFFGDGLDDFVELLLIHPALPCVWRDASRVGARSQS